MQRGLAVANLLVPFGIRLSGSQTEQVLTYLELLLRWNGKINLTAINKPEDCIRRHFGESFYLGTLMGLEGRLLDVGTGAGFPGLALKVMFPALQVILLEPKMRKCAFLKEVSRQCGFSEVEIRSEGVGNYRVSAEFAAADIVTSRAVGSSTRLIQGASDCLKQNGALCLWTTSRLRERIQSAPERISWMKPAKIPNSRERIILIGRKIGDSNAAGLISL